MSQEIDSMFSEVSQSYDTMNTVLSLGIDSKWREETARRTLLQKKNYKILDIACGTGELSIAIKRMSEKNGKIVSITGVDFNKDMLHIAKTKVKEQSLGIKLEIGDALHLRFTDKSFDVVTSSFAMRDFDDLSKFVKECYRVLKKDGKLVVTDMSAPDRGIMKYLFKIYFRIMVLEGMFVNKNAYSFLVNSIKEFDKKKLAKIMEKQGFSDVKISNLPFGVAFVATGSKIS